MKLLAMIQEIYFFLEESFVVKKLSVHTQINRKMCHIHMTYKSLYYELLSKFFRSWHRWQRISTIKTSLPLGHVALDFCLPIAGFFQAS